MEHDILFELEYGYVSDALTQLGTTVLSKRTLSLALCAIGRGLYSRRLRVGDASLLMGTLLEKGATFTECDEFGSTALHYFCQANQYELACIALERGANLHARDRCGQTPLLTFCIAMNTSPPLKVSRRTLLHQRELTGCTLPSPQWIRLLHMFLTRGGDLMEEDHARYSPSRSAPRILLEEAFYFLVNQPANIASLSVLVILDLLDRLQLSRSDLDKAVCHAQRHEHSELVKILTE